MTLIKKMFRRSIEEPIIKLQASRILKIIEKKLRSKKHGKVNKSI
jgi:hypothetical protein